MKNKKERLKMLLDKQKQKAIDEEEKREYETVLEEVQALFPNLEDEVEILSKEESNKIIDELFAEFPFHAYGIDWTLVFYKTIFSNFIDYESALAELVIKNHKIHNDIGYIIDLRYQHVMKTKLISILHRVEEVRKWDRYIYSPQIKLVIEFSSNDIAVGWKE
ncbi:hypothetical protein JTI58_24415 [Lysinibacillus fusiformis]|uniref:CDI toxin immunity protein n=1 Tax=Lysinibacillus fusiformis TaxID=28031 RepID=UPI001967220D|nr:hypothetical protein [Lysinibacillus fusiformis]QSB10076.1 hypothetical protein JTI58_24415 [Lysinibacillus fusiformis]